MPSIDEAIIEAKRTYHTVYGVDLPLAGGGTLPCLFRAMTYGEFKYIMAMSETSLISDEVIKMTVLHPLADALGDIRPGAYEGLVSSIIDCSGFVNKKAFEEGISHSRMKAMEIYSQMGLFVCKAFPSYIPEVFEELNHEAQMLLVAQAEMSMGVEFPWIDFFKVKKVKETSDVPKGNFDQLAAYTPAQVEAMTKGALKAAMVQKLAQRRSSAEERQERLTNKKDEIVRQKMLKEWNE